MVYIIWLVVVALQRAGFDYLIANGIGVILGFVALYTVVLLLGGSDERT